MRADPCATSDATQALEPVDTLCDQFEKAWREGTRRPLEDFLPADSVLRAATLEELARIELQLRLTAGELARVEEYLARFPELAADPVRILRVVAAEFQQRRRREPSLGAEEYRTRFPQLAATPGWESVFGTPERNPPDLSPTLCQMRPPEGYTFLAPSQSPEELGRLGNYRVLRVLGSGGMGVVFLAEDIQLQRPVALKVMKPALADNPLASKRFLREAQATASVRHDHVVTIHQVSEEQGVPFLAMELLEGETLEDRLRREGRLPLPEVLRIGAEMAEGLAAAHARGLVHRDIKPANLWLEAETGRVKVLDFGLARTAAGEGELTQSGMILGTPSYMSPEQGRCQKVDAQSDLFSLGCVLYRLSTGQLPFAGDDALSMLHAITTETPLPPRQRNAEIPAELSDLILKLLNKKPEDRPASARETAQKLRALLQAAQEPTRLPQQVPPRPGTSRFRRRLVAIGLLVLAAVAGAVILRLQTDKGELVLQANDKDIEVTVKQAGRQPDVIVVDKQTKKTLQLKSGGGVIEARELPDGLRFKTQRFELNRGDTKVFQAEMLLAEAPARPLEPGKQPGAGARPFQPEKPFVLMRQGKESGEFTTFAALWEHHQPGDEIVVHGDGPFVLPRVTVKDRSLVLRATPGFRPRFQTDESFFDKNAGWIDLQQGSLTTDGCDFILRNVPPGVGAPPALIGGEGPCVLRNGRFLLNYGSLLSGYRGSSLTIENSLLILSGYGLGVVPAGCKVTLDNNLVYSGAFFHSFAKPGGQTVRLTRNAFVCQGSVLHDVSQGNQVTLVAEGNLFDLRGRPIPVLPDGFQERIRWQGKDNVYAGLFGWGRKGVAGWNAKLPQPEVNSRDAAEVLFAWATPLVSAEAALAWWEKRLTQARQESGLPDLGPDLSLVGAGEAWLRSLAQEGKPVPRERLRPDALSGGRVALLRQGKEVRGFHQLQEAFDTAQDGDVLEIRTDAALPGGRTRKDGGGLTLRAAPGYRPVISGGEILVRIGTVLAVEGLTFAPDTRLFTDWDQKAPLVKQGRISRLTSCTFERASEKAPTSLFCLLQGPKGAAAEVVRCIVLGRTEFRFAEGSQVRFRECLFLDSIGYPTNDPALGAYELDRCIVCRSRLPARMAVLNESGPPLKMGLSWTVRNCLLESTEHLVVNRPSNWVGEKNLYRMAWNWVVPGPPVYGLKQWRALQGVQETGSVEGEPWLFDPQSWKLLSSAVPEGVGPDLGRVALRRPADQAVVRPEPAQARVPVACDKPFVLLRQGKEAGAFKTFAAAWEQHQPSDEIVIHGDGPFILPHLMVKGRALVLRAAPGFRPLFYTEQAFYDKPLGIWIELQKGSFTSEGCDYAIRNLPPKAVPPALLGGEGPCVLSNGRFLGFKGLLQVYRGPSLTVEDCLLLVSGWGLGDLPPRCEVSLTNNLVLANRLVNIFEKPGGQTLRLTRNAFICTSGAFSGMLHSLKDVDGVQVVAEDNHFDFTDGYGSQGSPVLPDQVKKVRWQGTGNVYAGLNGGLEKWNASLGKPETGSREVPSFSYKWAGEHLGQAQASLAWWTEQLARQRRESGLPELGPNTALVGPGEAYVRGLAQEGKPVSKERLRPDALPGGRVALLHQGKEVRGFHQIQDAFDAAQDGDVIEVRTDARLPGGRTRENRGNLILRAGPGYHPILAGGSISVRQGTALTLQGLAFAADAFLYTEWSKDVPLAKQGRVSQLAYCSFDRREKSLPSVECLFFNADGTPAEVLRCIVLGPTIFRYAPEVRVRFRDCLFGYELGTRIGTVAPSGTFEIDHCIAVCPRVNWAVLNVPYTPGPDYRWVVRNCLFDSVSQLAELGKGSWIGEKNVYRIAVFSGLQQVRAFTNSPETGSVEAEPLIADPQRWKLPPGGPAAGAGPDVDRIGRWTAVRAGPPNPEKQPEGKTPQEHDRAVAEWLCRIGALVTIWRADGDWQKLGRIEQLPPDGWRFRSIGLPNPVSEFLTENEILDHLQPISQVDQVYIEYAFSAAGLKRLLAIPGMATVEALDLRGTPFFDEECFQQLKSCVRLKKLCPSNGHCSPRALANLSGLPLQELNLIAAGVKDEGLEVLGRFQALEVLDLYGTRITDTGLKQLQGLKTLKRLNVKKTQVTEAGVTSLAGVLPTCAMEWDGGVVKPQK